MGGGTPRSACLEQVARVWHFESDSTSRCPPAHAVSTHGTDGASRGGLEDSGVGVTLSPSFFGKTPPLRPLSSPNQASVRIAVGSLVSGVRACLGFVSGVWARAPRTSRMYHNRCSVDYISRGPLRLHDTADCLHDSASSRLLFVISLYQLFLKVERTICHTWA